MTTSVDFVFIMRAFYVRCEAHQQKEKENLWLI